MLSESSREESVTLLAVREKREREVGVFVFLEGA